MKKANMKKVGRQKDNNSRNEAIEAMTETEEIEVLRKRSIQEAPESGSQRKSDGELRFDGMPLSRRTYQALISAGLVHPTDIQAAAIPHALAGRDILGAAKTGSGKTLAFVIPILEKLYLERWSTDDGLAAIIITPTRELALQIFEVIRTAGKKHQLSAGLVTGGKKEFEEEQQRVVKMNILVATPGRLLQHLEQTPGFDASQLLILVLDEADRILDMGFKRQLDSIVEYLPPRQTLLFSATQTKSVKDLARLSLRSPEYLAVHAEDDSATPQQLVQNYVVCRLPEKLDVLFSFLKTHLQSKIIVFFSTCSQVRFVYECFRGMQPGIPLTALHGKIKQERRTIIYMDFTRRKSACMFATDVAARGLDFPEVDWVVQVDAPEDTAMYIHRVGRTARYNAGGRALMLLLPAESEIVSKQVVDAGIPIKKLTVNPKFKVSVATHAAALLASQPDFRKLAKKAFTSYLRSLQLMPAFEKLNMSMIPVDEFAASLGLAFTPPVPVVASKGLAGREATREQKNVNHALDKLKKQIKAAKEAKKAAREAREKERLTGTAVDAEDDSTDSSQDSDDELIVKGKKKKKKEEKNKDGGLVRAAKTKDEKKPLIGAAVGDEEDSDGDAEFLSVKAIHRHDEVTMTESADGDDTSVNVAGAVAKASKKRTRLKIKGEDSIKIMRDAGATKVIFDEEGEAKPLLQLRKLKSDPAAADDGASGSRVEAEKIEAFTRRVKARLDESRVEDAAKDKERIREKHRLLRMRIKGERKQESGEDNAVLIGGGDDYMEEESGSDKGRSDDDGDDGSEGGEGLDDDGQGDDFYYGREGGRGRDSDSGDDGSSAAGGDDRTDDFADEDDEDEPPLAQPRGKSKGGGKDVSKGRSKPKGASSRGAALDDIKKQEEQALRMLNAR